MITTKEHVTIRHVVTAQQSFSYVRLTELKPIRVCLYALLRPLDGNHSKFSVWCDVYDHLKCIRVSLKRFNWLQTPSRQTRFSSPSVNIWFQRGVTWPSSNSWTSLKCSRNRSADDHMASKKNHLRSMVKENDTWQFTNWPFLISKSPTRARPTHLPLWLTAGSRWKCGNCSSHILFMSLLSPWEFSPARDKFTVEKKKKVSSPSELIFPSNILQEKCWW